MSDQPLDFKKSLHVVRGRLAVVGVLAALGLIAGGGFTAFIDPPMSTSTALVALPATTADVTAQAVIAGSTPVLTQALGHGRPAVCRSVQRRDVQVASVTPDLLSITAVGATAAQAESTANAVADSYVAYIGSAPVPTGPVPAQLAVPATNATVVRLVSDILVTAGLGALAGALIGVIAALAIGRADRRLRERDEIADAIGVPVLASVPVRHPDNAARWTHLLEDYEPSVTEAWRLRKALGDLGLADMASRSDRAAGTSLTVLSLSSDQQALALGPQLAVFAASAGIPTALVIGPEQGPAVAALRAATPPSSRRSSNLQVMLEDPDNLTGQQETALSIVVAVVDGETPRVADLRRTRATLLGVSAGAATADQLARVAASSAAAGRHISGILVADPDPADSTTGRVPQLARSVQARPTRLTSPATVSRRQTTRTAQ
jgi:capsular polysaccharide biosynthesis protein